MNKEKGLIKSIFNYSVSSWVNIIIGFAYTIISTRVLLPETYGMVSVFMSASSTLMYVVCLGLDASFIRFFNERPNNESHNTYSFKLLFLITVNILIVFFATSLFCFNWFNEFMFGRISWFLTIMLYGSVYSNLLLRFFNIIYRMTFNVKQYTIQNVLIQSSTKIFTLIAALINPSYEVVIAFQVIGIMGITIMYTFLQRKDIIPVRIHINKGEKIFNGYGLLIKYALFSAPLYISTNLNVLLTQQIVRDALGASSLGIYSAVNVFSTIYGAVQTGFSTFWSAYVYKNYKEEQNTISTMTDYVIIIAIISLSGFVLFRRVLYLFIGVAYQSSISFFAMLLMVNVFNLLAQATIYGIDIVKKNYITAITNCVYVALNAIIVYLTARFYGLMGVAIGVMISRLMLYLVNTIIGQQYYKTINNWTKFSIGLVILLGISVVPSIDISDIYSHIIVIGIDAGALFLYRDRCKKLLNLGLDKVQQWCLNRKNN